MASSDEDLDKEPSATLATNATTPSLASQIALTRSLYSFSVVFFVCIVVFFFTRDVQTGIIRLQDILTMLNPLLLIPLFYVIFLIDTNLPTNVYWHIAFLITAIVFIHGDGYHLAANAIHRYEEDITGKDVEDVIYLYDEELGHYYPYTGLVGLHILWLIRQHKLPFTEQLGTASRAGLIVSGVLHGLVLFIAFVEGKFAIPAIVFFGIVAPYCSIIRYSRLRRDPVFLFSASYSATGFILLIVWVIWQRGFPELTEAGLI